MLRQRVTLLFSSKWRPHAEQLKGLIAASNADRSKLTAARDYVCGSPWREWVEDSEDHLEAAVLFHKIGFGHGSNTFRSLVSACREKSLSMTKEETLKMVEETKHNPELFSVAASMFLTPPSLLSHNKNVLAQMPVSEKIIFAKGFWAAAYSHGRTGAEFWALSSVIASSLADSIGKHPKGVVTALTALAETSAPLSDDNLETLRQCIITSSRSLSTRQQLSIAEKHVLFLGGEAKSSPWLRAFCVSFASIPACPSTANELVEFFTLVETAGIPVAPYNIVNLCAALQWCATDVLVKFLWLLEYFPSQWKVKTRTLLDTVERRSVSELANPHMTHEIRLKYIFCLTVTSPTLASSHLVQFLEGENPKQLSLNCKDILLRIMLRLHHLPRDTVATIVRSSEMNDLSQEESIVFLSASVESALEVSKALVQKAVGRPLGRTFTHRKERNGFRRAISQAHGVLLLISLSKLTIVRDGIDGTALSLAVLQEVRFFPSALIYFLSKMLSEAHGTVVKKTVFLLYLRQIDSCFSITHGIILLRTMSAIGFRDGQAYSRIVVCLKKSEADASSVLCAAAVAQKLHLIPQFERSGLLDSLSCLGDIKFEDILILLRVLSPARRVAFSKASGVELRVSETTVSELTGPELVILLTVLSEEKRNCVLNEIKCRRQSLDASELYTEDAVSALELLSSTEHAAFEALFRYTSHTLEHSDEKQFMRLLRCVSTLPVCPNYALRTFGKIVIQLSDKMSANNAVLWLDFYVRHKIRDDSVGKTLVKIASSRAKHVCGDALIKLRQGTNFYGLPVNALSTSKRRGSSRRRSLSSNDR